MANLTLVYGMRLLPADEAASVGEAPVALKNGNEANAPAVRPSKLFSPMRWRSLTEFILSIQRS